MTPTLNKEIDVFKLLEEYADQENLSGIELLIEIINYFDGKFDYYIPNVDSKELAIALNQATPLWCKNKTNREYELVETGCYYDD